MRHLFACILATLLVSVDAPQCVTDDECGCTLDCLDPAQE
jgi:hypothetical protein